MKIPVLLFLAVLLTCVVSCKDNKQDSNLLMMDEEKEEEEFEETGAERQLTMWFQARAYPDPGFMGDKYLGAWNTFIKSREETGTPSYTESAMWSYIGPNVTIGGRILCVTIDPSNSNIAWAGSASGGIWKCNNAGAATPTWQYVEVPNLPVLGVASIAIHPSNSAIMYAGTGEVYRADTSNIGFNVWKTRGTYGVGILKSTDGGNTWSQSLVRSSSALFGVQMLKFDPSDNNTVYAAATDGLYRTTDAGVNWTRILNKTYVADIAIHPTNSNLLAASVGNLVNSDKGVYYSTNGGSSWTKGTGIPAFSGFIRLDNVSGANLYASVGIGSGNELYTSANFGQTWTALTNSSHCGGQYWFSHDLAINPFDTDSVMIAGVSGYRYEISSGNRTVISNVHSDMHDIVFDRNNRGRIFIANDGGVHRSLNGGATWSNINNGLSATQFYASLAVSPTTANIFIGGLQDNGTVKYNGSSWTSILGGDGAACAFHPNGSTVIYSNDARAIWHSTDEGASETQRLDNLGLAHNEDRRTGFVAPVAISKSDPTKMYAASDNLHISSNSGGSFQRNLPSQMTRYIDGLYKTAVAMAVSPTNANKVYVSTSPFSQNNDNTLNVSPPPGVLLSVNASDNNNYSFISVKNNLPDRFVMDFAISPTNDDSVFVVLGGFEDMDGSHIFVSGNSGTSWTDIGTSSVLPDVPFNAILIDPLRPQIIYAGCDFGVYVSTDRGVTWLDYNNGLTGTNLVMDLQVSSDNRLVAATHGRGVAISPLYSGTLPVYFSSFTGVHRQGANQLLFRTQNESNLQRFELERSTDGRNFYRITSFTPVNTEQGNNYQYDDQAGGRYDITYYRVKSVNIDGTVKYSPVVTIRVTGPAELKVVNTAFHDYVLLQGQLRQDQTITVKLYDAGGRLMRLQEFKGFRGVNSFIMNGTGGLVPGIYILEAFADRQRSVQKILKQ